MNINLDNYESFFLLYVDNELCATEKAVVDAFVQQYPYLASELELLQGLVLPAVETDSLDKNNLYRSAALEHNMQEAMLLHLDNELPEASSKELILCMEGSELLQQNWQQLLKTRLPEEAVIFVDKHALYKKEPARIVSFRVMRWAVAAALLAAGLFTVVSLLRQQEQTGATFANSPAGKTRDSILAGTNGNSELNKVKPETSDVVITTTAKPKLDVNKIVDSNEKRDRANVEVPQRTKSVETANVSAPAEKIKKISIQKKDELIQVLAANTSPVLIPAGSNEVVMSTGLAPKTDRPTKDIVDQNMTETNAGFAKFASVSEDEELNNDRILGMDANTVNRSKAGVFFKKLKRTVARSANIKTGNSLKIAGFEFAVK